MKKICIIMPYFGKWPRWFNLYLETCRYNSTINWLFFTDCEEPKNNMDNIKYIKITLADFSTMVAEKIGFKINIKNPMKICDIRPAFGVIFEDYLEGYDFWGHGDIDLLYGNIRNFISIDITEKYEIISTSKRMLLGNFTLYKNNYKINTLYKKIPGYKKLCRWPWNLVIDESIFAVLVNNLNREGKIKCLFRDMVQHDIWKSNTLSKNWSVIWNKGRMTDTMTHEELMYFHFKLSKGERDFVFPAYRKGIGNFCLSGERLTPTMNTLKGKVRRFINARVRKLLSK